MLTTRKPIHLIPFPEIILNFPLSPSTEGFPALKSLFKWLQQVAALIVVFWFGVGSRYAVLIDGEEKKAGSIFDDFKPSIIPAEEIDDPEDSKPEDWVDTPRYCAC